MMVHIVLPDKINAYQDKDAGSNDVCKAFDVFAELDAYYSKQYAYEDGADHVCKPRQEGNAYNFTEAPLLFPADGKHGKPVIWYHRMQQAKQKASYDDRRHIYDTWLIKMAGGRLFELVKNTRLAPGPNAAFVQSKVT